jgi:predicted nucleotidyltransferase
MNTEQLKRELASAFVKYRDDVVASYIFGSTVSGVMSPSSDIDIAVLARTCDKAGRVTLRLNLYADLCRKLKRNDIDLVFLDLTGNLMLNDEIIRNGQILYSNDNDARNEFELNVLHRSIDFKFQRRYAMGV